jgi:hypothetical protein
LKEDYFLELKEEDKTIITRVSGISIPAFPKASLPQTPLGRKHRLGE